MDKSPEAFRTISEVADWLDTPTHVLRFWESRFTQVKPVKRAGGRRYYRPRDMELLGGIKKLLHNDGMTIRGVQKLLREEGVRHVAVMSAPVESGETLEGAAVELAKDVEAPIQLDVDPPTSENVVPIKSEPAEPAIPATPPGDATESAENAARAQGATQPAPEQPAPAGPTPPAPPEPQKPLIVDVPDDPSDDDSAPPDITGVAASLRGLPGAPDGGVATSEQLKALYERLRLLRDRMNEIPGPDRS
ncbi:MAG: MerR family transcriptional regulator [Paracoccaceae bacterium]